MFKLGYNEDTWGMRYLFVINVIRYNHKGELTTLGPKNSNFNFCYNHDRYNQIWQYRRPWLSTAFLFAVLTIRVLWNKNIRYPWLFLSVISG